MLFSKVAALALVPLLAVATPTPQGSQCNVGSLNCCNTVQESSSSSITGLFSFLGIVLGEATGQVGVNCSPISVIGVSGTSCNAQPVCCTGNHFNGVIAVGCSPINLNL